MSRKNKCAANNISYGSVKLWSLGNPRQLHSSVTERHGIWNVLHHLHASTPYTSKCLPRRCLRWAAYCILVFNADTANAYPPHSGSPTAAPRRTCLSWSGTGAGLQSGTCYEKRRWSSWKEADPCPDSPRCAKGWKCHTLDCALNLWNLFENTCLRGKIY